MASSWIQFRFILLAFSVALLGLMAGSLLWRIYHANTPEDPQQLIQLPKPRVIADFVLTDQDGQDFSLQDFQGRWSLLFFGFTACPDICPDTLYQLRQAREALQERLAPEVVPTVYLVSVDPERDSPARMKEYLQFFDPQFIGLSGADAQLRALTLQLGIAYHVEEHEAGAANYAVDHSASILMLNPEGRLHAVLRGPHEGARIAADVAAVIERES